MSSILDIDSHEGTFVKDTEIRQETIIMQQDRMTFATQSTKFEKFYRNFQLLSYYQ